MWRPSKLLLLSVKSPKQLFQKHPADEIDQDPASYVLAFERLSVRPPLREEWRREGAHLWKVVVAGIKMLRIRLLSVLRLCAFAACQVSRGRQCLRPGSEFSVPAPFLPPITGAKPAQEEENSLVAERVFRHPRQHSIQRLYRNIMQTFENNSD